MINYTFGPAPKGIQPLIDSALDLNDIPLAQAIYDSRSSGYYGAVDLAGETNPLVADELVTAQYVFWDPELQRIRGQGIHLDAKDPQQTMVPLGRVYTEHCIEAQEVIKTPDAEHAVELVHRALNMGQIVTFAAWEFTRRPGHPKVIRLVYPRLLFGYTSGPELARTKRADDMPAESLDISVHRAVLASAIAYRNSR